MVAKLKLVTSPRTPNEIFVENVEETYCRAISKHFLLLF
jgi:hypothetical protein